jgi:membrane-associated phospholipid phosphatase
VSLRYAILALLPLGWCSTAGAQSINGVAQDITDWSPWVMRAAPAVLMLGGGEQEERIGQRMADAGIPALLATELLKTVINDDRPNDPNATNGFPSSHASAAWALAEAAAMEDGDLRPYTYTFAAAVTWSRVQLKDHTGFQALAGAGLGYAIGHASGRTHGGLMRGIFVHEPKPGKAVSGFQPRLGGPTLDGTGQTVVVCEWSW